LIRCAAVAAFTRGRRKKKQRDSVCVLVYESTQTTNRVVCERSDVQLCFCRTVTPEDTLAAEHTCTASKSFQPSYQLMSVQAFTRTQHITPRCSSLLLHPVAPRKRNRIKRVALPGWFEFSASQVRPNTRTHSPNDTRPHADPSSASVKAAFFRVEHHGTVHLFYERPNHRPVFIDPCTWIVW
jgi:hypothetical protein